MIHLNRSLNLSSLGLMLCAAWLLAGCPAEEEPTPTPTPSNNQTQDMTSTGQDMQGTADMKTADMGKVEADMGPTSDDMGAQPNDMGQGNGDVTYYQHIKPILTQACVSCHSAGQIGPFELDSFEKVKPMAASIESAVTRGSMPPWLPKDDCGDFRYKRDLTPAQTQKIKDWVAGGAKEGDPNATPEQQPPYEQVQLGTPSLKIDIGTDYTPKPPQGNSDDYRCFVVEPGLSKDEFLSAFETKPGNAAVVHHMLLFSVPRTEKSKLDQLSAAEPEAPGYTCFGGPKANNTLLGVWAPGVVPVKFPDGYGIPVKKDDLLVIQVHYNTLNDAGADRTAIDLHFTPGTAKKLAMLPVADNQLSIAPGDANAVEGSAYNLPNLPITLKLFGVVPHMHARGKSISVKVNRQGQERCLIDIPSWDFNWQNVYIYKDPIEIKGGDSVKLECVFDNSPERNQALGLNAPPAQPITWGEGTLDEMCLNYVIIEDIR